MLLSGKAEGMPGGQGRKSEGIRIGLCKQVFSLLDVLKGWVSEARTTAAPSSSGGLHSLLGAYLSPRILRINTTDVWREARADMSQQDVFCGL